MKTSWSVTHAPRADRVTCRCARTSTGSDGWYRSRVIRAACIRRTDPSTRCSRERRSGPGAQARWVEPAASLCSVCASSSYGCSCDGCRGQSPRHGPIRGDPCRARSTASEAAPRTAIDATHFRSKPRQAAPIATCSRATSSRAETPYYASWSAALARMSRLRIMSRT